MLTLTKQAKLPRLSGLPSGRRRAPCDCTLTYARGPGSPLHPAESSSASRSRPALASRPGAEVSPAQVLSTCLRRQVPLQSHCYCSTDTSGEDGNYSSGHRPRLRSLLCFFLGSSAVSCSSESCALSLFIFKQLFVGLGKFRRGYLSYLKFMSSSSSRMLLP